MKYLCTIHAPLGLHTYSSFIIFHRVNKSKRRNFQICRMKINKISTMATKSWLSVKEGSQLKCSIHRAIQLVNVLLIILMGEIILTWKLDVSSPTRPFVIARNLFAFSSTSSRVYAELRTCKINNIEQPIKILNNYQAQTVKNY